MVLLGLLFALVTVASGGRGFYFFRTRGKIYGVAPSALLLPYQVVLLDDLSQFQISSRTLGVLHVAALALRCGMASRDAQPGVSAGCRPALVRWG